MKNKDYPFVMGALYKWLADMGYESASWTAKALTEIFASVDKDMIATRKEAAKLASSN
jgi:hypothetical protein